MDYQQMSLFGEQDTNQLRLYQGGSLASRTAQQESVRRLVMNVICGRKCAESLARLSPDGLWLRMCQGYYQVRMDGSLQEFSEILPRWGLMLDGELQALPHLEPSIDESGWRLLPTPVASDYRGGVLEEKRPYSDEQSERAFACILRKANADYLRESAILRAYDGIPDRVDRTKSLGNAVVPQQFYPVFKAIADIECAMGGDSTEHD